MRFVRGRWVHWGTPWGRRVHPGQLGSLGCALGVVGFIRGRSVCALGVIRGRWVHRGALSEPSVASGTA